MDERGVRAPVGVVLPDATIGVMVSLRRCIDTTSVGRRSAPASDMGSGCAGPAVGDTVPGDGAPGDTGCRTVMASACESIHGSEACSLKVDATGVVAPLSACGVVDPTIWPLFDMARRRVTIALGEGGTALRSTPAAFVGGRAGSAVNVEVPD